jgi:hypothetical protein
VGWDLDLYSHGLGFCFDSCTRNYGVLGFTLILALMLRIVIKVMYLGSMIILGI